MPTEHDAWSTHSGMLFGESATGANSLCSRQFGGFWPRKAPLQIVQNLSERHAQVGSRRQLNTRVMHDRKNRSQLLLEPQLKVGRTQKPV